MRDSRSLIAIHQYHAEIMDSPRPVVEHLVAILRCDMAMSIISGSLLSTGVSEIL
jgi:hypothetical protein